MSKKPQFWEKLKKNYHIQEATNHDVIQIRTKERKKDLGVINSCSETSLPYQNSYNRPQNRTRKDILKYKKEYLCDSCDNAKRNKERTSPKSERDCDNSVSEKSKLSSEYIDNLVCTIKELKSRVKYFEHQCKCGTVVEDIPPLYRESKQIGDYDIPVFQKHPKNQNGIRHNHGDTDNTSSFTKTDNCKVPFHQKISSYVKNISDHQKSIYTTNGHTIQDACFKASKNLKNRSNASIVMSLHSTSKQNFVKVNPHPDSKNFQAAAEEFIEQAEELKAKIGYILECCGCNHASSFSEASESMMPSDCNYSLKSSNRECADGTISDRDLKFLFGAVSSQYSEILTSLSSIKKQIKTLNKQKVPKPLPKSSSNGSMYLPKTPDNSNKVDTHIRSAGMSGIDTKVSCTVTKKPRSTEVKTPYLRAGKNSHMNRNLEPVVMVYEPILPECEASIGVGICQHCGRELNSCTGCPKETKVKARRGIPKNRKGDETTQKYGFVVTYTPDISVDLNATPTPSTSKTSSKSKMKEKKKIIPCLWF